MNCCNSYGECERGPGCPSGTAMTITERADRITELENQLRRSKADMAEIIDQIERLDLSAWAQIKYATDNGLPIPDISATPQRNRRESDMQIEMLDKPSRGELIIFSAALVLGLMCFLGGLAVGMA